MPDIDLKSQVLETIEKNNLIEKNDKIVVAVSGGPDSISLLHILLQIREKYNLTLFVAHVNHMIRENAKIDQEYVKSFCIKNNIEYFIKESQVKKIAKENKIGTEEAGRNVRYEFFDEVLNKTKSNKIAIAHNKNDKAETIILNILRGTGTNGLVGIEPKSGKYIRPLIESERVDIEKYCKKENLNPRIDETNMENIYSRNKVRNIIIPYIKKEFNENFINTMIRLSEIMKENNDYIEKKMHEEYEKMVIEENNNFIELNLKKFNSQDIIIRKKIIFHVINELTGTINGIEKINIEDIIRLAENNIGNKYLKPNKNIKVEMKNKQIYFEKL